MTKASPSENLQERLIQQLRDYQRAHPPNKRCFDCNEMMPQYICLDFKTFVCTACSGIHREFAHRVKSISMSKFTESEVKSIIKHGGNEAAQTYWRKKHDPSFRPSGGNDGERTRNFIRLTYIDRKWTHESPRQAKGKDPERKSQSSKTKEKKCKSDDDIVSSSSKSPKATTESGFDDFSNFKGSSKTAATVQLFGDFDNFDRPAPLKKKVSEGFADFGNFEGLSTAQKTASQTSSPLTVPKFGSFKIAPPPGSNFPAPCGSTVLATENIMGLSSPTQTDRSFEFDTPTSSKSNLATPVTSSLFDFDAPTPAVCTESCLNSEFVDPFSNMTDSVSLTAVPASQNMSPFDAFNAPDVSSSLVVNRSAPLPASTASCNVFDALGEGDDGFGKFSGSVSLSRTHSTNSVLDAFAASTAEKHDAVVTSADPFAAFDGMQQSSNAAPAFGSAPPTANFGRPTGFLPGNSVSQQQAAMQDPFGFACATGNSNGFSVDMQQHHHPVRYVTTSQSFGGSPQQQQIQNMFGGHQMQQQPMQSFVQGQQQLQNQQQQYGRQQGFSGQQQPIYLTRHQYSAQFLSRPAGGTSPAPVAAKTAASASLTNDPFASLNIGNLGFGDVSSNTAARTESAGTAHVAPPTPANGSGASNSIGNASISSGSIFNAQPQAQTTASFPLSHPNTATFADPDAFADFSSAHIPAQTPGSAANPFDLF